MADNWQSPTGHNDPDMVLAYSVVRPMLRYRLSMSGLLQSHSRRATL